MHTYLDAGVVRTWAHNCVELLGRERAEIDALNVFPVPDGDTGTNLYLTLEAAAEALEAADPEGATPLVDDSGAALCAAVDTFARGALLGARGNSGVITSQLLRGFADSYCDAGPDGPREGVALAAALASASESAYGAVAVPREGTVLSVSRVPPKARRWPARTLRRSPKARWNRPGRPWPEPPINYPCCATRASSTPVVAGWSCSWKPCPTPSATPPGRPGSQVPRSAPLLTRRCPGTAARSTR